MNRCYIQYLISNFESFTFLSQKAGVAIGAGWQSVIAIVNIACYYLIGVPIGALLGYVAHLEVKVNEQCNFKFWNVLEVLL